MDIENFSLACEKAALVGADENGIGTLKEKSLHATLKYYFQPDNKYHEIKIKNFIADIAYEHEIIEIQTTSFHLLRNKLKAFLPEYKVILVYPIIHTRVIHWVDPNTGLLSSSRKSPKKEKFHTAFKELYKIKNYLKDENLSLAFPKINVDDFRFLDGYGKNKKNRATKGDILPTDILDILYIKDRDDFKNFLPVNLNQPFTSKDYALAAKISIDIAQVSLNILNYMKTVKRVGKKGSSYLYEIY